MIDGRRRTSTTYEKMSPGDRDSRAWDWSFEMRQFGDFSRTDQLSLELTQDGQDGTLVIEFTPSRKVQRVIFPKGSHFYLDLCESGQDLAKPLGCRRIKDTDDHLVLEYQVAETDVLPDLFSLVSSLDAAGLQWNRDTFVADARITVVPN